MAWKVWKSKEERIKEEFASAVDHRNRGDWAKAIEKLDNVYRMSLEVSDPQIRELGVKAAAMAYIYRARLKLSPENLNAAYKFLSSIDPELYLELPYKVKVGDAIQEIRILAEDLTLFSTGLKPEELEKLAQEYMSLGRDKLILNDALNINVNPTKRAFLLLGLSRYIKAEERETINPEESVSLYSEASGYLIQSEDKEWIDKVNDKLSRLSKTMKCYICGRSLQGEKVHFVYVKADITPYMKNIVSNESPSPIKEEKAVVLCRGCYTAIYNLADDIARDYYEKAIEYVNKIYVELSARIEALEREIRHLKAVVRR